MERAELLKDQAGLQKLHDNLQQDYETLLKEKEAQKETERKLRGDLRKLQVREREMNLRCLSSEELAENRRRDA